MSIADKYGIEIINGRGATERYLADLARQDEAKQRKELSRDRSIKNKKKALKKSKSKSKKANRKK